MAVLGTPLAENRAVDRTEHAIFHEDKPASLVKPACGGVVRKGIDQHGMNFWFHKTKVQCLLHHGPANAFPKELRLADP